MSLCVMIQRSAGLICKFSNCYILSKKEKDTCSHSCVEVTKVGFTGAEGAMVISKTKEGY